MNIFDNEPKQQPQKPQMPQMPKLPKGSGKIAIISILLLIVIGLGSTTFYTVQEQERAAIITFGKFTGEEKAGLHFKLPYPIQQVVKVPAEITQKIHIGYTENQGKPVSEDAESLMITGDENIVSADAVVEWKISNIEKYLFNIEEPDLFLRNASIAAIRTVIGATKLDSAITDGKTEVQIKVKEKLVELNQLYDTGIFIQDIKFQDIEPPDGEVSTAFKEVTNAREEKNTKINNAKKYENDIIPKARGEAQAILENAEGVKKSRILNAEGDVAKFNAVQQEYAKNPAITENRLILETLEKILPNAKIIVSDSNDGTVKYLPLNEMLKGSAKGVTTP